MSINFRKTVTNIILRIYTNGRVTDLGTVASSRRTVRVTRGCSCKAFHRDLVTILAGTGGINLRLAFIILSLVGSLFTVGCNKIPPEYQAFLDLPVSEQHQVMMKLPLDKRIDYYLAGMRYIEPPQIALADDVASEGKRALPFLVKRLRDDKDERNQA